MRQAEMVNATNAVLSRIQVNVDTGTQVVTKENVAEFS
jgi:hypothetical protein